MHPSRTGYRLLHWLCLAGGLACALLLRAWFVLHTANISGDTFIYGDIAKNWMTHGVYGLTGPAGQPVPTLIRLPGYPLFLVLCFRLFGTEHYTAVMLVQAVLDTVTCGVLGWLASNLFGRRAGLAALWLAALCPFTANYVSLPLAEIPVLAMIALAFMALERWQAQPNRPFGGWLWILAAALGCSILLRPEQVLLAASVLPAMLWAGVRSREALLRRLAPVCVATLCTLLPLLPWTIRNARTFHVLQPLAPRYATDPGEFIPFGFQRWYRTWAIDFASTEDIYWNYDGARIELSDLPTRAFDSEDQYDRTAAAFAEYNRTNLASPAADHLFAALAEERIRANPLRYYVALPVARLLNMIFRPRTENLPISLEWWQWSQSHAETAFAAAYAVLNALFVAAGLLGLRRWLGLVRRGELPASHRALALAMAASIVLRCLLLLTLDNSEPRYTLEFFPVLVVWASALLRPRQPAVAAA
ncbi:MAG: glycosyltransferase family 39 protein [Acidobacteriota bacterium]|nr:glycosyltransferase family 39 protein [Acidobacteriota bacterium]